MLNQLQPEIQKTFKQSALELMADRPNMVYPGYPTGRLVLAEAMADLPDGPWDLNPGEAPEPQDSARFAAMGLELDSTGRPLHPWLAEMVTNPDIGVLAGRGFYWNWGPNKTADPIVIRHDLAVPHVLLIDRGDTGEKALPGGFVDKGELAEIAAAREAREEALLDVSKFICRQVYDGPLSDIRATAHAWSDTTAFRFDVPNDVARNLPTERYKGGDDAEYAQWIPADKLQSILFGSHSLLVGLALNLRG